MTYVPPNRATFVQNISSYDRRTDLKYARYTDHPVYHLFFVIKFIQNTFFDNDKHELQLSCRLHIYNENNYTRNPRFRDRSEFTLIENQTEAIILIFQLNTIFVVSFDTRFCNSITLCFYNIHLNVSLYGVVKIQNGRFHEVKIPLFISVVNTIAWLVKSKLDLYFG